jgi:hypothetical protein
MINLICTILLCQPPSTDGRVKIRRRLEAKQKPVPNLSEAIRRLVELGLKVKPKS